MARWVVVGTKKIEDTVYSRSETYVDARSKRDAWQRFRNKYPDYRVQSCFDDELVAGDELPEWHTGSGKKSKKKLLRSLWDTLTGTED